MSRTKKPTYSKSKRFDKGCRNHGSCGWCKSNRTHKHEKRKKIAQEKEREHFQR